ncbi:MAG: hypothetical protein BGO98_24580 [Myxococcales bacterium 68-20]|nr:MAG: hypothetical protein BGO98_24580 [Myxococcales bacterium 68-20]
MKARRTAMGLAPAPHLGGANRAAVTEAEARKQRVLARIAAMDARGPQSPTGPPPPAGSSPPPSLFERPIEPVPLHSSVPPPGGSSVPPPGDARLQPPPAVQVGSNAQSAEDTYIGPPAFGQTTAIMMGPLVPARTISSDGKLPAASGWDVHGAVDAEVSEPAPNTARMLGHAAATTVQTTTTQQLVAPSAPPPAALALRPYEPSGGRAQAPGKLTFSGPIDKRLVLLNEPHSTRAASFRVLRDNLLTKSMPRVVAVTSAVPNDGKTTCAANLALALAEQPGTRVLLVDANFFSPDLSKIFEVDRLAPVTPPDPMGWLAPYKLVEVMPSVHVAGIPENARQEAKRFEHHRFEALIERFVRVSYDFVIIDTPALRGTPAVTQLLSTADGALLVVRSGGTTTRDLRRAAEQLPPKKALGIALMDALL